MKTLGIILAGGKSTRLYPATLACSKQLLPVYDKPMVYYPLSTLMLAGIRDYILISTGEDLPMFETLFKDAKAELGINIQFAVQHKPNGIAEALKIANVYRTGNYEKYALILGDNIFYGATLSGELQFAELIDDYAVVVSQRVSDPTRFGVIEFDEEDRILSIEEKPLIPKSNMIVTGLYFYPPDVFAKVDQLVPSMRGELEITDLNNLYLKEGRLHAVQMKRGMAWFDSGTPDALLESSHFVQTLQTNQGVLISSPHEVAYNNEWIDSNMMNHVIDRFNNCDYGRLLGMCLEGNE